MGHDDDGPLRPVYIPERPPWIGLYSDRNKYTKQKEWWAEPGLRDTAVRNGKWNGNRKAFREEDPNFFDPKVEDGKSLSGPEGRDSNYHANNTMKGDQPGNLFDFQRKVMEGSLQYKNIVEKYKLSPEHPGLAVSPVLDGLPLTQTSNLAIGRIFPSIWQKFGPRFFDKPLNEGHFEKAACAAKYAAIFMLPYTMLEIRATHSIPVKEFTGGKFILRYLKFVPFPMGLAATWALSISTAATIRHKDDLMNHFIAGPITGAFVASVKGNLAWGLIVATITTLTGVAWQYQRMSDRGLHGNVVPQNVAGFHGGPHHWKMLMHGDYKVPEHTF